MRRSTCAALANSLNDIGKDHPDVLVRDGYQGGWRMQRRSAAGSICHALRSAVFQEDSAPPSRVRATRR